FNETKQTKDAEFICSPIREAINHKEELLVTVLVHNFTEKNLIFNNKRLRYSIDGEIIAEKLFALPAFGISPRVSMPWTFIFPKDSYVQKNSYENGHLEIL
ncbi:SLAP domain-containing protein, partial [Butyricicoccus sp. 1XD8-22]